MYAVFVCICKTKSTEIDKNVIRVMSKESMLPF